MGVWGRIALESNSCSFSFPVFDLTEAESNRAAERAGRRWEAAREKSGKLHVPVTH